MLEACRIGAIRREGKGESRSWSDGRNRAPLHTPSPALLHLPDRSALPHAIRAAGTGPALKLKPDFAERRDNLAVVREEPGGPESVLAIRLRALGLRPEWRDVWARLQHRQRHACDWSYAEESARLCETLGVEDGSVTPVSMLSLDNHPSCQVQRSFNHAKTAFPPLAAPLPCLSSGVRIANPHWVLPRGSHDNAACYPMVDCYVGTTGSGSRSMPSATVRRVRVPGARTSCRTSTALPTAARFPTRKRWHLPARDLDIAIDLKGQTRISRGRWFAARPAPVPLNYLGSPGTTGADFIGHTFADRTGCRRRMLRSSRHGPITRTALPLSG